MKIRVVIAASKAKAVQVVRYQDNKRIILKHIGFAPTEEELSDLMKLAEEWIKDAPMQLSIFPDENPIRMLHLNHITFIGVKYHFFHKQVRDLVKVDDFPALFNPNYALEIPIA